jgi:hypothetical protein
MRDGAIELFDKMPGWPQRATPAWKFRSLSSNLISG